MPAGSKYGFEDGSSVVLSLDQVQNNVRSVKEEPYVKIVYEVRTLACEVRECMWCMGARGACV